MGMLAAAKDGTSATADSIRPRKESTEDGYRTDIDGLRAIAVTSVVLYHAGVAWLSGGFVGVDIFFVISGYLIGAHIYRDVSARRFSLGRFYRKRAKRILPALFFLLLFCYGIALLVLSSRELTGFAKYALGSVFSYSNVTAWQDNSYFGPWADQRPLLMTWSLGVEEQFYLFIPLLMLGLALLGRNRPRRPVFRGMLVLAVLSFGLSVWGTMNYRHSTFYLLPSRAWELLAGVLMAIYEAGPEEASSLYGGRRWSDVRSLAGVAAILYAVLHYGPTTMFPGQGALPPVMGAVLLLSAPAAWLNRFVLSSKPFRWIGLVSYSWYLWHWPLLSFARISADRAITTDTALVLCGIALGMAWISYRFIEQPFRHSKMAVAPLLIRYAAASVVFALPAVVMMATHGLPGRFPVAEGQDRAFWRPHPCMGAGSPVESQVCLPAADGRQAIALMGDSHADAIAPQMHDLAEAGGMRLYSLIHASCPPLIGAASSALNPNERRECLEYNRAALRRVVDDPAVRTVVLVGFWADPEEQGGGYLREGQSWPLSSEESDANFRGGLDATVLALHDAGKRVILVQDNEALKFDAYGRQKAYLIPVRGWIHRRVQGETAIPERATNDEMYVRENEAAAKTIAQVAAQRGAITFDLRPRMCSDSSCAFYADGTPLYIDTNHLSPAGVSLTLRGIPLF
jgi:peptidoglycan/LPS O-acetylase OafA/YrhL